MQQLRLGVDVACRAAHQASLADDKSPALVIAVGGGAIVSGNGTASASTWYSPVISSLSPASVTHGTVTTVTIHGSKFSSSGTLSAMLNGSAVTSLSSTSTGGGGTISPTFKTTTGNPPAAGTYLVIASDTKGGAAFAILSAS
jgi:hypothetical protein